MLDPSLLVPSMRLIIVRPGGAFRELGMTAKGFAFSSSCRRRNEFSSVFVQMGFHRCACADLTLPLLVSLGRVVSD